MLKTRVELTYPANPPLLYSETSHSFSAQWNLASVTSVLPKTAPFPNHGPFVTFKEQRRGSRKGMNNKCPWPRRLCGVLTLFLSFPIIFKIMPGVSKWLWRQAIGSGSFKYPGARFLSLSHVKRHVPENCFSVVFRFSEISWFSSHGCDSETSQIYTGDTAYDRKLCQGG